MLAMIERKSGRDNQGMPVISLAKALVKSKTEGEVLVFTDVSGQNGDDLPTDVLSFHLCVGDAIRPLDVSCNRSGGIRIFNIPQSSSPVFAAAVTATLGEILRREGKLPRMLHLFGAEGELAARLCKFYWRIPFVFSLAAPAEITAPLHEPAALNLPLPAGCGRLGALYLPEQAAALEAEYVLDEQGGNSPAAWQRFFSMFSGKVVHGLPPVDTTFWQDGAGDGVRAQRKEALLASAGCRGNILVLTGSKNTHSLTVALPEDVCVMPLAEDAAGQRAQLQAADFLLAGCGEPTAVPLAALAAGCVLVAHRGSVPQGMAENCRQARCAAAYIYDDGAPQHEVLLKALRDRLENRLVQQTMRQQGRDYVQEYHSPARAAQFYGQVYRGLAPVKLPFVASGQNLAQTRIWRNDDERRAGKAD